MDNRGFFLTWQAIRRQLAAMPNELYLVRLIHHQTGRPFPGERLWTAPQLASTGSIRFLRARNCEGCDVYIQPYAGNQDAASASRKQTSAASQKRKISQPLGAGLVGYLQSAQMVIRHEAALIAY